MHTAITWLVQYSDMHDYKSIIFLIFIRAQDSSVPLLKGGTLDLAQRARQNERALWNFELTRNKHHFHFFVLVFLLDMSRCTFHLTQMAAQVRTVEHALGL